MPSRGKTADKAKPDSREAYRRLRDTVYTYFYYLNKPVHLPEILLQFKDQRPALVREVIEDLIGKGKIFEKLVSKSRIFCLSQEMEYAITDPEYTEEVDAAQDQTVDDPVLRFLRWRRARLASEAAALKEACRGFDSRLGGLDSELSTAELREANERMRLTLAEAASVPTEELVPAEQVEDTQRRALAAQKELRIRTCIFKDVIGALSEKMDVSRRELMQLAGIEEEN